MEEERAIAVLKQFYSKVHQSSVSMDAVTQQLRSCHFLTPVHYDELKACDTRVKKTTFIVEHVVKYYLEDDEEKPLNILLKLIGEDDNELHLLAKEMKYLYSQKPVVLVEKLTANGEDKYSTVIYTLSCIHYVCTETICACTLVCVAIYRFFGFLHLVGKKGLVWFEYSHLFSNPGCGWD